MPRKISRRKAIQAMKKKAADAEAARKAKVWPGTRRVAMIGGHGGSMAATLAVMRASMNMMKGKPHD